MEFEFYNYDEVSTSSLVPEGDYDVVIEKAEGKADSNGKMRIFFTARITKVYDPKNNSVVSFKLNGQPQIKMPGDPEYYGKELKQIIEAAHIPYTKTNSGSIRFDTDNWLQREMTVTVKHTKSGDGSKTYANMTAYREKVQNVQPTGPAFSTQPQAVPQQYAQPVQQQYVAPQQNPFGNAQPQTPPQPMWGMGSKRS